MGKQNNGRAIEERPIAELVPYARNARTHSDHQVAEILASMVEFGFTNPVLADADGIVAGHGRVLATARIIGGLMVAGRPFTEAPAANDDRRIGEVA